MLILEVVYTLNIIPLINILIFHIPCVILRISTTCCASSSFVQHYSCTTSFVPISNQPEFISFFLIFKYSTTFPMVIFLLRLFSSYLASSHNLLNLSLPSMFRFLLMHVRLYFFASLSFQHLSRIFSGTVVLNFGGLFLPPS